MSLALPLTTWTQNALADIFNASAQAVFDKAFDHFLAKSVTITLNDAAISRAGYKKYLEKLKFPQQKASVQFPGLVESVDKPTHGPLETGVVGGFYEASITQGQATGRPFGLNILTSSLIADIDNDPTTAPNPPVTDLDARRVFKLTLVDQTRTIPF
ncbi:hypothetical protein HGRIS_004493 [Hohenbuehelia grisea]|uniref:Uncharacterized protein n=1 Tax=Hohenbuehelia grisea TaxID=104357 RepID=A0ABR3JC13_9AGAR